MDSRNEKCNKILDTYTKCKYSGDKEQHICYIILLKYLYCKDVQYNNEIDRRMIINYVNTR
jgi:hypothetical protein